MNRRPLVLLAIALASFVASACTSTTAPRQEGCSGYVDSVGNCVTEAP